MWTTGEDPEEGAASTAGAEEPRGADSAEKLPPEAVAWALLAPKKETADLAPRQPSERAAERANQHHHEVASGLVRRGCS